jgi:hypothetical protein
MDRRGLLRTGLLPAIVALAGCLSDGGGGGTPAEPTVTDTEFAVLGRTSGSQTDDATVTFDDATVTVEGTIWGSDGCQTAVLDSADYDAAADELTVAVAEATREDAGDACTQAIVETEYRARVAFDGGFPGTVVVTHDHGDGPQQVTTASA